SVSSTAATATDNAGNTSDLSNVVTVKIDKTKPTAVAAVSAGTLGTNGWYTSDVTVHFTCSDATSGISTCPADQVLSAEGAPVSSTAATATDNAGNTSDLSNVVTVKIDKTKPTIAATAAKADTTAYTSGTWTNQTVTVHFTCDDGSGSGLAGSCPADQVFSTD